MTLTSQPMLAVALLILLVSCVLPSVPEPPDLPPPQADPPAEQPPGPEPYRPALPRAAAGADHSLVIDSGGTLWAFGQNHNGQLGIGGPVPGDDQRSPVRVDSGVTAVWAEGSDSSMYLKDGRLYVMGYGPWVEPATEEYVVGQATPLHVRIPYEGEEVAIRDAALGGDGQIMAIDTVDRLWVVGADGLGFLGLGSDQGDEVRPPRISATGVRQVSAGVYHAMILKTDGSVWTAGSATAPSDTPTHRLGTGTPESSTEWQQIADGGRYVAAGLDQSLIIKTDDSLWMFGDNSFGQCGRDPAQNEGLPTPTRIMGGVSQASTFGRYTAAITTDGRLLVWGSSILPGDRWEPTPAGSATDSLSVSNFHMVGRGQDGAWWGAGENGSGQLLSLPTGTPWSSLGSVGGP